MRLKCSSSVHSPLSLATKNHPITGPEPRQVTGRTQRKHFPLKKDGFFLQSYLSNTLIAAPLNFADGRAWEVRRKPACGVLPFACVPVAFCSARRNLELGFPLVTSRTRTTYLSS